MKRISNFFLVVFAVGILITLFAGVLAFFGYVAAIIIGGETATAMCVFIYKTFFPVAIRICSICVGCGLVGMYLNKVKALTYFTDKKSE